MYCTRENPVALKASIKCETKTTVEISLKDLFITLSLCEYYVEMAIMERYVECKFS